MAFCKHNGGGPETCPACKIEDKPFRIGNYNLYPDGDGGIWIGDGTGEGGRFSEEKLRAVIDKFYRENF
jgi:hypothetical protein